MQGRLFTEGDRWYRWVPDPAPGVEVRVRLDHDEDGRWRIDRLELSGEVSAKALRAVPLGRIEATANALFGRESEGEQAMVSLTPDAAFRGVPEGWDEADATSAVARPEVIDLTVDAVLVEVPDGSKKPDEFYGRVADLYRELAAVSARPAAVIAEANDLPVTTVHRWVKESRRRGLLGPGRAGTAG